jgi:hypothetical protein
VGDDDLDIDIGVYGVDGADTDASDDIRGVNSDDEVLEAV